jgi:RNA polymerase sigma-70 factor (ECF subfamily)
VELERTPVAETGSVCAEAADFEAAFREHWRLVYQALYRLLGQRAEAEDLAVEVFWRLHQRMDSGLQGGRLRAWLYRVAVNLGLNALRAGRRRSFYEDAAGKRNPVDRAVGNPLEEASRAEERKLVRRTLARLKPRSARLLALRYSGLSYAELAEALKLSPASIGSLLARAEKEFEREFRTAAGAEGSGGGGTTR